MAVLSLLLVVHTSADTPVGTGVQHPIVRLPQLDAEDDSPVVDFVSGPASLPPQQAPECPPPAPAVEPVECIAAPASVDAPCLAALSLERANASCGEQPWLAEFARRIEPHAARPPLAPVTPLPRGYQPWWDHPVRDPAEPALRMSVGQVVEGALRCSSYVHVVCVEPQIRQTTIVEEQAAFDWRAFLEATYTDVDEPVGNILTTGTLADRYKDRQWVSSGGFRRQNLLGGNLELAQRVGSEENNSRFLLPNPQATTELELSYTQPLLNGLGRCYNESRIVLAQIHSDISADELAARLEEHLTKVTEAYWELYRARAEYFQRMKLVESARETLAILEGREQVDAERRQVLRAQAAVTTRMSDLVRARTSIRNAESRLRLLVNDPALVYANGQELVPTDAPLTDALPVVMVESLYTALHRRPDISRGIREVRAAAVRLGVAQHEVLPRLDLVTSTYVQGLAGQTAVAQSFGNQFADGRPSYSVGLLFELPFGNRAATAQQARQQLEMNRAISQFRLTVEESLTAVEIAVREVETTYGEMVSKYDAMAAVAEETSYLSDRWRTLPGTDDSAVLLLDNLLDAQDRLADEEVAMVQTQIGYAMAIVRLKQAMGILLTCTPVGSGQPASAPMNSEIEILPAPPESSEDHPP